MIAKLYRQLTKFSIPYATVPLALLGVTILGYAVLIPWLGFYWDDWAFVWISQKLGPAGLERYFSTNRPVWGLIYQTTTQLLGSTPWHWQVFGIFWRWVCSVSLWGLLRLMWPENSRWAVWAALLFVVYPGFDQQPIAITYGHFFIILTSLFVSFAAMLVPLFGKKKTWLWTALGMAFSLLNLLSMEYFFLLDLLRPFMLWWCFRQVLPDWRKRLKKIWVVWLPYLGVFLFAVLWRTLIFQHQTQNYQPRLLQEMLVTPLPAVENLLKTIGFSLWQVTLAAWGSAFRLPDASIFGARTLPLYVLLIIVTFILVFFYLWRLQGEKEHESLNTRFDALPVIGLSLVSLIIAGWPFWVTYLPVGLEYPNSRFTLPFIFGAVLLVVGLLQIIPLRDGIRVGIIALLVAASLGYQFQVTNAYRRDWNVQKQLFWQMAWRVPGLKEDTAVLANDLPTHYTSDNSLTSPLNWIYAPRISGEHMPYVLYYASIRQNTGLRGLKPDLPIDQTYLAATFHGSTSQVIAVDFEPPACLRILDSETDSVNTMLPGLLRDAALLSKTNWILPGENGDAHTPPAHIYGAEPVHSWCYYFEKADLARQEGDWKKITALGEEAFSLRDYPNDPAERFPFIEAYANIGNWRRAEELTREAGEITPLISAPICRLWQRIDRQVPTSTEKVRTVESIYSEYGCASRLFLAHE
jgi:hypothetical protein